jgi:hypothetical protein
MKALLPVGSSACLHPHPPSETRQAQFPSRIVTGTIRQVRHIAHRRGAAIIPMLNLPFAY